MRLSTLGLVAVLVVGGGLPVGAGPGGGCPPAGGGGAIASVSGDFDCDGTVDVQDFCTADPSAPSPCGLDTDTDGYGNACDGDFSNDGVTNASDATIFLGDLNGTGLDGGTGTDMNCDGVVNATDAGLFLGQLNGSGVPGPSGLPCSGTSPCP